MQFGASKPKKTPQAQAKRVYKADSLFSTPNAYYSTSSAKPSKTANLSAKRASIDMEMAKKRLNESKGVIP